MDGRKTYRFTVRWGEERDTDDAEGRVIATSDGAADARTTIRALLPRFTGTIAQVPPRFSAVKIDGERAYDLAREGEVVELAARPVEIHRLELVETPDADHAVLAAECGKGTYVRALARDMGRAARLLRPRGGAAAHRGRTVHRGRRGRRSTPCRQRRQARSPATEGAAGSPLLPVAAGLAALPALAVSRADAATARPRPGGAAARPRRARSCQGCVAVSTPGLADGAGRGRAGRAAPAAHLQSRASHG